MGCPVARVAALSGAGTPREGAGADKPRLFGVAANQEAAYETPTDPALRP